MKLSINFILFFFIFLVSIILYLIYLYNEPISKRFYNYVETFPNLEILKANYSLICSDVDKLENKLWIDWTEKSLYDESKGMSWTIFPFYGFGIWIEKNCKLCPNIYKIIKNIPKLRTASLSKLGPQTKLTPHQGWANLSNYVLRCHFGIKVPDICTISVDNEEKQQKEGEIIVFDDSRTHSAENKNREKDRIVLIIDIERPSFVDFGDSPVNETTELLSLIKYFNYL